MSIRLSNEQRRILQALQWGHHLKVHRTLDGAKVYRLHGAAVNGEDSAEVVAPAVVQELERSGYVQSNMKFPAATLLLTERGAQVMTTRSALRPVGPRRY